MKDKSSADVFLKIRKNVQLFEKAVSEGNTDSAKGFAEELAVLYRRLADIVPLRELEYLGKAKEWEKKIIDLTIVPQPDVEQSVLIDPVIDEDKTTRKERPPHLVFISYSSPDLVIATSVCSYLESHGITCWISPRNLIPGANYPSSIIDAIDRSRLVILIYSKNSNKSPHVFRELEESLVKNIRILQFRIKDEPLSDDMKYFINIHHWLDAFGDSPEKHFDELLNSVKSYLDNI